VKQRILTIKLLAVLWAVFAALASASGDRLHGGNSTPYADYFSTYPPTAPTPLDPKVKTALDTATGVPPLEQAPVAETRPGFEKWRSQEPLVDEPVARVDNRTVPGPHGGVPIRIYRPEGSGPFPMVLYLHGGGWTVGNLDTHDGICRSFCHRLGAVVISVDYRLAPENKFPVPLEDCYAALQWSATHAAEIQGDHTRLAVAGDSAGGNLAAAVALYARDHGGPQLCHQVLIYPVTNHAFDTASYWENTVGHGLTRDSMLWFWDNYLNNATDGGNPYASPLQANDLSGLPPALILTAHYDPLRDEGEAYGARLHQAGVPVQVTRYLGMFHGFVLSEGRNEQAERAIQQIADTLRAGWQ
jgi:acetyl esterase